MPTIDTATSHRGGYIDEQSPPWATDCSPAGSPSSVRHRHPSTSSSASISPPSRDSLDLDRTMPTNLDTEEEKEEPTDADKLFHSAPQAPHTTATTTDDTTLLPYLPHQPKSLAGIATRSFCLGIALALGLTSTLAILLLTPSPLWRVPFFLTALAIFHFLEFWTTAAYNTPAAETSSFLLTSNWPAYAVGHSVATLECLVTHVLWPGARWTPFLREGDTGPATWAVVGLALAVLGQTARSVAMVHAGRSFNHIVQSRRREGHVLVTSGIYSVLRHPSYFGFFWWALGTQMVMGNVVCFVAYTGILWRFFSSRIRNEEKWLVAFFGGDYVAYRERVRVWIPFIR